MAELQLAVSRLAEAPAGAFEATRAAVGAVRTSLESSGITETAIQVSRLRLNAVYDYSNNRQRLSGHAASADITVAITDVNATDGIITAAIDSGANAVQSLVFDTTHRAELEESALRAAVADALRKASVFADAVGVAIGNVVHLEESGGSGPTPLAGRMLMAESADPAFVSGSIRIEASVMVRFSIRFD
jgi:uncharacterized protein YggE